MKESDIVYEEGNLWVKETTFKGSKYWEVFRTGITHSTRCATVSQSLGWDKLMEHVEYQRKREQNGKA